MLTLKPLLVVLNVGDDPTEQAVAELADYRHKNTVVVGLQGRLEMELAQMSPDEAAEFLAEYGIQEPGLKRMIRLSYALLGLQSFFTVGEDEVRAWTIPVGATAVDAAGAIHSDLARGFIRAEVIGYETWCRRKPGRRPPARPAAAGRQGLRRAGRRYSEHPLQRCRRTRPRSPGSWTGRELTS